MVNSKVIAVALMVVVISVLVVDGMEMSGNGTKIDCGSACAERCSLSGRPNLCKRACGSCCAECNCVPPGTSGNYEACPCYAALTTHHNKLKCP